MQVQAYFEEWSRLPGQTVRMAVSTSFDEVVATLERATRGPMSATGSAGPHTFGERVPGLDIAIPGEVQATPMGSFAECPLNLQDVPEGLTFHCWFCPSVPQWEANQTLAGFGPGALPSSLTVGVRRNRLLLSASGSVQELPQVVHAGVWYSLVLALEHEGNETVVTLDLMQVSGLAAANPRQVYTSRIRKFDGPTELLRLGAQAASDTGSAVTGFNGKIENPSVFVSASTLDAHSLLHQGCADTLSPDRAWRFDRDFNSSVLPEMAGRAPSGRIVNGAERAVTGHNWTGEYDSFTTAPHHYGAIYFHSDEMIDAQWRYNLEFDLPSTLASGVYFVCLRAGEHEDRYPLFVGGTPEDEADVLFVLPTNTYLAYANDRFASADLSPIMAHKKIVSADELYLNQHPEFGLSCYDVHADGSPVRYSSRRRPLVNVRPHYPNWLTGSYRHFAVDLFFIEWLERAGVSYHVATDEDVHAGGEALLTRYKVVTTGSHPEYWTNPALKELEHYVKSSGRLMYLGGNGFYWVTTIDPERPWIIEVRRDNGGLRAWDAPPGERNHSQTGEIGGLWRYRGRGPNKLCGVAFAMEGFSKAQGYTRTSASYDAAFADLFEGIEEEVIGDFGYILGGAAGDECDRLDLRLGSPPQATILASASGFGPEYLVVNEDIGIPMPHLDGPGRPDLVRSDMIHLSVHGGGEVFSAGSIAFAGALAWNGFDNNIAKLTNRVLHRFIKPSDKRNGS